MTDFEQTSWVQTTELDEATAVLSHLMEERKKAIKTVSSANEKLDDADERLRQQQHVVDLLQSKMPAAEPAPMEGEAEEEYEDAEIIDEDSRQIEGDVVDPVTGEMTSRAERGEGTVRAWWPEADEPVATEVGPTTSYGELVADFIHGGEPDLVASDQVEEYSVVCIGDGRTRELNAAIVPEDHGLEFAVVYGDAGDLEAELRTCANCGEPVDCTMVLSQPETGCGCGGHAWRPVEGDVAEDELAQLEANKAQEQAA